MKPIVFLDFDGTITRRDTTDAILEAYADPHWLRVEEEWKAGHIGSRECLATQMALVRATANEMDALLDGIEIDTGFVPLLEWCSAHGVAVHIVSDGFDYCIQRMLGRPSLNLAPHLEGVRIISSHLERIGIRWQAGFSSFGPSCVHRCGTCKPVTMTRLNPRGAPTVFVGDGLSDMYAAGCADMVFAKGGLAEYCQAHAISYIPYDDLAMVAGHLDPLLGLDAAFTRDRRTKPGARDRRVAR